MRGWRKIDRWLRDWLTFAIRLGRRSIPYLVFRSRIIDRRNFDLIACASLSAKSHRWINISEHSVLWRLVESQQPRNWMQYELEAALPSSSGYVSRHRDKRMHFSRYVVHVVDEGARVLAGRFQPGLYVHQNRMWHLHIAGASHMRAREYAMARARWPTYNS